MILISFVTMKKVVVFGIVLSVVLSSVFGAKLEDKKNVFKGTKKWIFESFVVFQDCDGDKNDPKVKKSVDSFGTCD